MGSIPGLGRYSGEGNGNPLQYSCLGNPVDRGTWQATVHGAAKSRTWLCNCQVCCQVTSVMSDSVQPHGLQPTRLLHPWDFPGNSTGVGCHCLLPTLQLNNNNLSQSSPLDNSHHWLLPFSCHHFSGPPSNYSDRTGKIQRAPSTLSFLSCLRL